MLQIKDLKSGYDGMKILHGINIEVKPAEIVAIIGPNGSGKSTTLKIFMRQRQIVSLV